LEEEIFEAEMETDREERLRKLVSWMKQEKIGILQT
jgi:hypothetical protein